jgi:hypothetical protein
MASQALSVPPEPADTGEALAASMGEMQVSQGAPLEETVRIEGVVTSVGSSFAIVNHDCYVPRHFVSLCRLEVGQAVIVLASPHATGRNKWRAKQVSLLSSAVSGNHTMTNIAAAPPTNPEGASTLVHVFAGEVTSLGQGFCIVNNDVFVHASLYEGRLAIGESMRVRVHAFPSVSGRNNWRAVAIEPLASFSRQSSTQDREEHFPYNPISPFDARFSYPSPAPLSFFPGAQHDSMSLFSPTVPYPGAAPPSPSFTTLLTPLHFAQSHAGGMGIYVPEPSYMHAHHMVGVVTSHGRDFCIVNHEVYVPRYLLGPSPTLEDGRTLLQLVVCPYHTGRNKWRALSAFEIALGNGGQTFPYDGLAPPARPAFDAQPTLYPTQAFSTWPRSSQESQTQATHTAAVRGAPQALLVTSSVQSAAAPAASNVDDGAGSAVLKDSLGHPKAEDERVPVTATQQQQQQDERAPVTATQQQEERASATQQQQQQQQQEEDERVPVTATQQQGGPSNAGEECAGGDNESSSSNAVVNHAAVPTSKDSDGGASRQIPAVSASTQAKPVTATQRVRNRSGASSSSSRGTSGPVSSHAPLITAMPGMHMSPTTYTVMPMWDGATGSYPGFPHVTAQSPYYGGQYPPHAQMTYPAYASLPPYPGPFAGAHMPHTGTVSSQFGPGSAAPTLSYGMPVLSSHYPATQGGPPYAHDMGAMPPTHQQGPMTVKSHMSAGLFPRSFSAPTAPIMAAVPLAPTVHMSRSSSLDSNEPQLEIAGTITSHGTGFCILNNDVYVPIHLVEGRAMREGTRLTVRAVQRLVGRNRFRAISIVHYDGPTASSAAT